jgi:tripartite-type tricarboxylate transporter receptor subunit TctC
MRKKGYVRIFGMLILLLTAVFMAASPALAAKPPKLPPLVAPPGFPSKDTTMIVAFTPGGSSDMQLRLVQKYWREVFPNNLVIVHRTGAGGEVGFRELARSTPDGYTLGGVNMPHVYLQPLARSTGFTLDSFAYICQMVEDPQVIAVHKDSPIKDMKDLISRALANPGRLTVGNVGTFTGHHVTSLLFQYVTKTRFTIIPYVGAADQMAALRGKHVDFVISNLSDVTPHLDAIRVFGITTSKRHSLQPTWPTFNEQGIPIETAITRGIAAPVGIDPAILRFYREGLARLSALPSYQADMAKIGQTYDYLPGETFEAESRKNAVQGENLLRYFGVIK